MNTTLDIELSKFEALCKKALALGGESLCDWAVSIPANTDEISLPNNKRFALSLFGIVHGNEIGGVAVINQILEWIFSSSAPRPFKIAIALGNPKAAKEDKRFLDRDLNRSFERSENELWEDQRARDLEKILDETHFLIDFHQTMLKSDRPFFIFPYNKKSFDFARAINPNQAIVTHWGKPFSEDGRCTDEYTNRQGGIGITFETGQNGFDPYQVAVGFQTGINAVNRVPSLITGTLETTNEKQTYGDIFTWSEIIAWPESGLIELTPGLTNFTHFDAGESIGTCDGKPIKLRNGGRIIFPKYVDLETQKGFQTRPAELIRVMKKIELGDLPKERDA